MDYIEVSGKNVDEALTNALIQLETTSDKVEYEVIEKGSSGFLGMFNKPAVIRVRKKAEEVEETVETVKKPVKKYSDSKNNNYKDGKKKFKSDDKKDVKPAAKAEVKSEVKAEVKSEVKTEVKTEVKPAEVKPESEDMDETKKESSKYTTIMPNEEIERRITTFLTDMFKAMGFEVTIKVSFDDPECVYVDLSGPNMGVLIGKRGQTLDSLQYLTNLAINKHFDSYYKIKIDTEDYRHRRKETLENLAKNISYKVKRTKHSVSLEPMNPFERRVIHSALQNDRYVTTHSEGEEPYRHVVVSLKK